MAPERLAQRLLGRMVVVGVGGVEVVDPVFHGAVHHLLHPLKINRLLVLLQGQAHGAETQQRGGEFEVAQLSPLHVSFLPNGVGNPHRFALIIHHRPDHCKGKRRGAGKIDGRAVLLYNISV